MGGGASRGAEYAPVAARPAAALVPGSPGSAAPVDSPGSAAAPGRGSRRPPALVVPAGQGAAGFPGTPSSRGGGGAGGGAGGAGASPGTSPGASPSSSTASGRQRGDLSAVIRDRVSLIAERNASLRASDSPKLSDQQLRRLKGKERAVEELRICPCAVDLVTTYSFTVTWTMLYSGSEVAVHTFLVQVMALCGSEQPCAFSSSLDVSPDAKVEVVCRGGEWVDLPDAALDRARGRLYVGGLGPASPPLVFRARGKNAAGWGAWSAPSEPFRVLSALLPAPRVSTADPLEPYSATVEWAPGAEPKMYGQVLYWKLFARRIVGAERRGSVASVGGGSSPTSASSAASVETEELRSAAAVPEGFFSPGAEQPLYTGRETEFRVGLPAAKLLALASNVRDLRMALDGASPPLAPGTSYAFRVECATGLTRSDRRYNSLFRSAEATVEMPRCAPAPPRGLEQVDCGTHGLTLAWRSPLSDGGCPVSLFKVYARTLGEEEARAPAVLHLLGQQLDGQLLIELRGAKQPPPAREAANKQPRKDALRFLQLYSGSEKRCTLSAVALLPGQSYVVAVVALNTEGCSLASQLLRVRLPTEQEEAERVRRLEEAQAATAAAAAEQQQQQQQQNLQAKAQQSLGADEPATEEAWEAFMASPAGLVTLPEGWQEYWDPATEELFYYNVLTGQNQWQSPAVSASATAAATATAGAVDSGGTAWAEAAQLARDTVQRSQRPPRLVAAIEEQRWRLFRKKRFAFLNRLHRVAQERAHSPQSGPHGQPAPGKPARKPPPLKLSVKREQLVLDSVRQLQRLDASELLRKLQVVFEGERGIDSGGLAKEWFIQVSQGLLAPELCLFRRNPDSGTYAVDPRAALLHAGEAAVYLRAFGRVCGKAFFDQQLIEAPLCSALLRQMQGLKPGLDELAELDPSIAKSLRWLLDNDAAELLADGDLCFAVTVEEFGTHREVELLPGGAGRAVTAESKAEYVALVVDWHLRGAVAPLLGPMLAGLWEVVPAQQLQGFSTSELAMLLNGRDEVDVDELRAGCVRYSGGYQEDSPPVALFWEVMASLPHERRAHVLRFITGCSKVPLDGYPPFLPFTITKSEYGKGALCTAHCCFNQLVLPPYETHGELKAKLLMSCDHAEGFEMT